MRQFNNYEAVQVNNAEEAMEFLQYLEDNTDLKWRSGDKPTEIRPEGLNERGFPIFIESGDGRLCWTQGEKPLEAKTKIIPLSEFLKPKVTYTREQAEKVFEDNSLFHNNVRALSREDNAFLDYKFPKSTLEQVTDAVKDLGDFKIEQTISGAIMISPINK